MPRAAAYSARMSDAKPNDRPEPEPEGAADNSGGVEANQPNPDLPMVEPDAD